MYLAELSPEKVQKLTFIDIRNQDISMNVAVALLHALEDKGQVPATHFTPACSLNSLSC
jgi:hypothetical protein